MKISLPRMGVYTELIKEYFESLDLKIHLPPKTTNKTISLGVKNSPQMVCYPFKQTLGNMIESLEQGADTLLMYDSEGICKFRHYWITQKLVLEDLGYKFEILNLTTTNFFLVLKKLSRKPYFKILKNFSGLYKKIKELDREKEKWSETKPNIGIIGEIFCSCDNYANFDLERKLESYEVNPVNISTLSEFIREKIPYIHDKKRKFKKQARKYLNGPLGGHGYENIYNLLYLIDKKIDGIIHILPLSCSPESISEIPINHICRVNHIPLLRIPVDENSAEANLETRLETFSELIKLKQKK